MAPMKTRPATPPQSAANCWIHSEMPASGGGATVTPRLSAPGGDRFSRRQADLDAQAAERGLAEAQLAVVQGDLLSDDRQAEPRPRRRRGAAARERLERGSAFPRRDARAVVVDRQREGAVVAPQRDPHAA